MNERESHAVKTPVVAKAGAMEAIRGRIEKGSSVYNPDITVSVEVELTAVAR